MSYDFGRHLTMLPSRGLRPAQFGPLNSRHSAYIYSNASRKVRRLPTLEISPQHTSASAGRRVAVAAMQSRAHDCGTAIAMSTPADMAGSSLPFPEPPVSLPLAQACCPLHEGLAQAQTRTSL
jgi:hypothetical protein